MGDIPAFSGYPTQGLAFLKSLEHNNNRDWFEAHKQDYIDFLRDPTLALVAALGARLKMLSPGINVDMRPNGGGSMTRIHRDLRFSKDKTPYNTHVDVLFWEGPGKKTEHPAFGVRVTAEGAELMAGMHGFSKAMLEAYRAAVLDAALGAELIEALGALSRAGRYTVGGQSLKRAPQGYDPGHPRAELLRYTALFIYSPLIPPEVVTTPALVDACFAHCRAMALVFHWLVKVDRRAASGAS